MDSNRRMRAFMVVSSQCDFTPAAPEIACFGGTLCFRVMLPRAEVACALGYDINLLQKAIRSPDAIKPAGRKLGEVSSKFGPACVAF
jgi:hypothetical protein